MTDPDDLTLESYSAGVRAYVDAESGAWPQLADLLDTVAGLHPGGRVLEFGSGTGRDAALLEARGMQVDRTDAAPGFLDLLRSRGHDARRLDVRSDPFGGPYDVIYAFAVFLHLSVDQLADVLTRCAAAVRPGGHLAFTVKQGDGAGWTTAKLDRPRHFTYWRAPALQALLDASPWRTVSTVEVTGRAEDWIFVIAQA